MKKSISLILVLAIFSFFNPVPAYAADTLQIYYNSPNDGNLGNVFDVNWKAQTFTTTGAFTISKVKLYLNLQAGSPGNVTVELKAVDGGGKPTGAALASKTQAFSAGVVTFAFTTPYALSATTQYAIVVSCPTCNGSNYMGWNGDASDSAYSGGGYNSSADSGATWGTPSTIHDFLFETYSSTADAVSDYGYFNSFWW